MEIVTPRTQAVSDQIAEQSVRNLLAYLGEDVEREGLIDTPQRVAKALLQMTEGYSEDAAEILSKQFNESTDNVVVLKGIRFVSLCEHHMLPFVGTADVGYLPGERIVGLSKLARLVQCFAKRLQVQERLTDQVAQAIEDHCKARGVGVVIKAHHSCMGCRGVRASSAEMVTSALRGAFKHDASVRAEFMALVQH